MSAWLQKNGSLAVIVVLIICGQFQSALIPFFLGALVDDILLSVPQASDIVAAGTGGSVLGTLLVFFKGHLWDRRRMIRVALLLLFSSNLCSFWLHTYYLLMVLVFISGVGSGAIIALCSAALADSDNPARRFGLVMMSLSTVNAMMLYLVASVIDHIGVNAIFSVLFIASVLGGLLSSGFPRFIRQRTQSKVHRVDHCQAALAIVATFIIFTGFASFWPFVERMATEAGIAKGAISLSYSMAAFAGVLSGLLANVVGERFGYLWPIIVSCGLLVIAAVAVTYHLNDRSILVLVPSFLFSYLSMLVFNNAHLAKLDSSGRVLVLGSFVETGGWFVGPLLAGQVLRAGGDYLTLFGVVVATIMAYLILKITASVIATRACVSQDRSDSLIAADG